MTRQLLPIGQLVGSTVSRATRGVRMDTLCLYEVASSPGRLNKGATIRILEGLEIFGNKNFCGENG